MYLKLSRPLFSIKAEMLQRGSTLFPALLPRTVDVSLSTIKSYSLRDIPDEYPLKINSPLTWYSHLNSCSRNERRRSSHESSNAVRIGSFEERAIKDGEAKALYAFIRLLECLSESSLLDVTHSSHLLYVRNAEIATILMLMERRLSERGQVDMYIRNIQ